MSVTVDDLVATRDMGVDDLLAVLVATHGRIIADQLIVEAAKVARGENPRPRLEGGSVKVVWPLIG